MSAFLEFVAEFVLPCLLGLWYRPRTRGKRALRRFGVGALVLAVAALAGATVAPSPILVISGLVSLAAASLAGLGCYRWGSPRAGPDTVQKPGPAA